MSAKPYNLAIILAAGSGLRAAQTQGQQSGANPAPLKQLWPLAGLPLWQHSWHRFATHPDIDQLCLLWPPDYVVQIQSEIDQRWSAPLAARTTVIAGGKERSDSSAQALAFCQGLLERGDNQDRPLQILIHDAARPLVSKRILDHSLQALRHSPAAVCALEVQDSLLSRSAVHAAHSAVHAVGYVQSILDRKAVMQSQTPQSFHYPVLREAFQRHRRRREISPTDDISVLKHYLPEQKICVIAGEASNMKLTCASDLHLLELYYNLQQSM